MRVTCMRVSGMRVPAITGIACTRQSTFGGLQVAFRALDTNNARVLDNRTQMATARE